MARAVLAVGLVALVVLGATSEVRAEPPPPKDWEVQLLGYGWIPSLNATVDLGDPGSRHIDTSLLDTINSLELGAFGLASVRYKRFVGLVDAMYARLGDSESFGDFGPLGRASGRADVDTSAAYVEALGGYRVYQREGGLLGEPDPDKVFGFDLLTGLIYTWVSSDVEVDIERAGPLRTEQETRHFGASKDWVVPFVGARISNDFTPRLRLETYGGAGGFGVGNGPDLSWQLTTILSWRFTDHLLVSLGHRLVHIDFDDGTLDGTLHGPIVGLGYRF